jgi:hypothetical protein
VVGEGAPARWCLARHQVANSPSILSGNAACSGIVPIGLWAPDRENDK